MSVIWSWRNAILASKLPATTKHVLMVISVHMNDMGEGCYPSTKRIAELASLSERSVCTHIDEARKLGWIYSNIHGFNSQGWARNEYRPAWPKGTEAGSVRSEKGTEPRAEGTEPDDRKALKDVQSIVSLNEHLSKNIPVKKTKAKKGIEKNGTTRGQRLEQYLDGLKPEERGPLPYGFSDWAGEELGWRFEQSVNVFKQFRDYWKSAAGAKGVKADWPATWRNWCRREAQRGSTSSRGQVGSGGSKMSAVASAVLAERLRETGLDGNKAREDSGEPEWLKG
jgi:hypothetical protein